ncbi:unnamed protein product [Soboliphyme baturini]|uniref:Alpha-1,2-Mannosidase n=1 Tax=Soboliphyme baturini TaxID=241478 RepID=A0A183J5N0_9BILA|nr:unnamed protein product [Soboliphyme baturini]
MMEWAWDGYAKYAWGDNEVKPVSKLPHRSSVFGGGKFGTLATVCLSVRVVSLLTVNPLYDQHIILLEMLLDFIMQMPAVHQCGATIVDSLDTLYIMGLQSRFEKATEWVQTSLDLSRAGSTLSVFETTIRYIGGLLSAYALSNNQMFVEKAVAIADLLLPAFNTPTGIPYGYLDVIRKTGKSASWATGGSSILSEFGTLHMEFEYLSYVTKNPIYYEKVINSISLIAPTKLHTQYHSLVLVPLIPSPLYLFLHVCW